MMIFLSSIVLSSSHTLYAESELTENTLRTFLSNHYEQPQGLVVAQQGDTYYVQFDGPPDSGVVEVYRNKTIATEDGQKLIEETIGTAQVRTYGDGNGTIEVPEGESFAMRPGDRFRPPSRKLYIHNRSELSRQIIRNILRDYPQIEALEFVEDPPNAQQFVLRLEDDRIVLKDLSQDESSRKTVTAVTGQTPETRSERYGQADLRERASFDRPIHDFEWIELPTQGSIRILMLAAQNAVGFARFDEELHTTHWLDLNGTTLDISYVQSSPDNPAELFFLAVTQHNEKIRTHALTFNVLDRSVQRHWSEPNVWIRSIGSDQFLYQKIGLNTPWSGDVQFVRITRDDWEQTGSSISLPPELVPRGYTANNSTFAYLDDEGHLTVRKNNANYARGVAQFGELPESVSPQRNDRGMSLHPGFPLRKAKEGYRTLLPENIASGITFIQGLRDLRQSRLYHLKVIEGTVETLWESNRLTGYVSRTEWFDSRYWAMLVNPENKTSSLQEFTPAGMKQ